MNIHMNRRKGHLQEDLQGPTWDAREKQWPSTPLKANIFFLDFELAFLEMGILCFHKKKKKNEFYSGGSHQFKVLVTQNLRNLRSQIYFWSKLNLSHYHDLFLFA